MVGQKLSKSIAITQQMTAQVVGSGDVEVYATPMMIALMEGTAAQLLSQFLDDSHTSVGTSIQTSHISATPVGMKVTATAEIIAESGKKVEFLIRAKDESGLIGEGIHTRVIVNREVFLERAQQKLSK